MSFSWDRESLMFRIPNGRFMDVQPHQCMAEINFRIHDDVDSLITNQHIEYRP